MSPETNKISMNGTNGSEMVPFLHLTDRTLMERTTAAMQRRGTAAFFRPLSELKDDEVPSWVETNKGGWVLFLDRGKMDSGSSRLGLMMSMQIPPPDGDDDED